jgi:hypothetical protein
MSIAQPGVLVETWSGDSIGPTCNVRGKSDVRHYVRVLNLRLYPADVKCNGAITSNPRLIEFSCSNSSGTPDTWEASIRGLGDGMAHAFSPCTLIPTSAANGTEIVNTEVVIDWPVPGKKKTLSLTIEVAA